MIDGQLNIVRVLKYLIVLTVLLNIFNGAGFQAASEATAKQASISSKNSKEIPIVDNVLTTGWFDSEPYYTLIKGEGGVETYSGIDAELVRAVAHKMGYKVSLKPIEWSEQLENLKNGVQHFAVSATFTEERTQFAYFSDPYRREDNSFFVRKGEGGKFKFNSGDMKGFVASLKASKARIAITEGMVYAAKEINEFIVSFLVKTFAFQAKKTSVLGREKGSGLKKRVNMIP